MWTSVLKVPLDAVRSVTTPLEALSAHVQMVMSWLLMGKPAMVCTWVFPYLQVTHVKKTTTILCKQSHTRGLIMYALQGIVSVY